MPRVILANWVGRDVCDSEGVGVREVSACPVHLARIGDMVRQSVLASPDPQLWRIVGLEDDAQGDPGGLPDTAEPFPAPIPLDVWLL